MSLRIIIKMIELLLYIALPVFIISTFYIISIVKKNNYNLIKDSIKTPFFPNLDLSFFKEIQKQYFLIKQENILPLINNISFYTLILGFILLFILIVIQEIVGL